MNKYVATAAILSGFALTLALDACRSADQYPPPASAPAPAMTEAATMATTTTAPAATTTAP